MKRAADLCTGLRVALAPVLAWQLALSRDAVGDAPLVVFLVAAATDYMDGMLARAAGTASGRGRVFDHCADAFLLFPAFFLLALQGRMPLCLPLAATTAFALYLVDGWRRGRSLATIDLVGSRSGAIGGVLNYGMVGAAATAAWLDAALVDRAVYAAAFAVAAVNALAAMERMGLLLTTARGSLAAETEVRASRSSP
jgi:phosphatidylglycerophosphate synthase